ncbi:MAG TPA: tyrosine--tRNA ligase [archaeon]|nr:tyrosine--tRNA ligase [archaeon]
MDIGSRIELIKQVGEEVVTEEELMQLLETKTRPIAYDGFEPSGMNIHIAQGLLRAINTNKMTQAGVHFKFLVADWHAWANNKMGGDLEKIQTVGKYFVEVWRSAGMDLDKVEFVWASEHARDDHYWKKVMQVARNSTVSRIVRCGQIMGRKESEVMQSSQILYPCMQCADIFHLKADITQLGMDQRKVNVLAREIGPKMGFWKPVIVSHHMLMGLLSPTSSSENLSTAEKTIELKMSKSIPDSAIFMMDSPEEVKRKIEKAYCPAKTVHENPLADYMKYIIFEKFGTVNIRRPSKFGGDIELENYREFARLYDEGKIHPADLKSNVSRYLNELLEPIREKLQKNKTAQKLEEEIKTFKVTR